MNKNKSNNKVKNVLDKKSKANKTIHEVGIKTSFYVTKNADVFTKVRVVGSENREREVRLPASTLMYFYPFYFYYDWGFKGRANRWVLKVADNAPKQTLIYKDKDLKFTDCVDLNTYETFDNKIYQDNLALMYSLDELSNGNFSTLLTPEIDKFSIKFNYEFIATTIASVKQKCKDRYDIDYIEHFGKSGTPQGRFETLSVMETARDRLLYSKYATDKELSMLIKMGAASRITRVLSKLYGEI